MSYTRRFTFSLSAVPVVGLMAVLLAGCSPSISVKDSDSAPAVVETQLAKAVRRSGQPASAELVTLEQMEERLADARVVLVGENHTLLHHHQLQLQVIQMLEKQSPGTLVVGMEFFQQSFQPVLDAYIAGDISEAEMLKNTEYFERWQFDYRLYQPILRYLREQQIPAIALNVPLEVTQGVSRDGYKNLDESLVEMIPHPIHRDLPGYRERLDAVFATHPNATEQQRARFYEVQLLWDEGMAERAAVLLAEQPERRMVILAGNGHVAHRNAIPDRILKRIEVPMVSLAAADTASMMPENDLDFMVEVAAAELPESGKIGVELAAGAGQLLIKRVMDNTGAAAAGLNSGEIITTIAGMPLESYADLRIAMLGMAPGDEVEITVANSDGNSRTVKVVLR